jgi:uncharacterized membrane protein YtjA (UPF0391 family)
MRIPLVTYALIFLTIALLAGVLGLWVVAGMAAVVAKFLFFAFVILFLISLGMRES